MKIIWNDDRDGDDDDDDDDQHSKQSSNKLLGMGLDLMLKKSVRDEITVYSVIWLSS